MALINYNRKARCGPLIGSPCVTWEEGYNDIITEEDLPCNASVGDVVLLVSEVLGELKSEFDLTNFNKGCFTFDKNTQKIKDLLQEIVTRDCAKSTLITGLQTQIDAIKNGEIELEVDLACLANQIDNCETPPKYTIKSLFELLINQNC